MDILFLILVGVALIGFGLGRVSGGLRRARPPEPQEHTVLVKRVKSSYRNPAQTYQQRYDEFKTRSGLYAPIKPGKGSTADDIDVEGKR
ncbi:MAG: hypothetical protein J7559_04780 [Cohnella sp.]|nr:hypothetical protein [Cohnella sp.]